MIVDRRSQLTDNVVVLYCGWRLRCKEVRTTYARLDSAPTQERPLAFAAFHAALDREELAAHAYAEEIRLLSAAA